MWGSIYTGAFSGAGCRVQAGRPYSPHERARLDDGVERDVHVHEGEVRQQDVSGRGNANGDDGPNVHRQVQVWRLVALFDWLMGLVGCSP